MVKNLHANAGDTGKRHNVRDIGLIPGLGQSPGGGYGNSIQYSCMGNSMDRGTWKATLHTVTKNQI